MPNSAVWVSLKLPDELFREQRLRDWLRVTQLRLG